MVLFFRRATYRVHLHGTAIFGDRPSMSYLFVFAHATMTRITLDTLPIDAVCVIRAHASHRDVISLYYALKRTPMLNDLPLNTRFLNFICVTRRLSQKKVIGVIVSRESLPGDVSLDSRHFSRVSDQKITAAYAAIQ